jgi:hypothetical protein
VWQRKWFVLKRDCALFVFRAPEDVVASRAVPLIGYTRVANAAAAEGHSHALVERHPSSAIVLAAESPPTMNGLEGCWVCFEGPMLSKSLVLFRRWSEAAGSRCDRLAGRVARVAYRAVSRVGKRRVETFGTPPHQANANGQSFLFERKENKPRLLFDVNAPIIRVLEKLVCVLRLIAVMGGHADAILHRFKAQLRRNPRVTIMVLFK